MKPKDLKIKCIRFTASNYGEPPHRFLLRKLFNQKNINLSHSSGETLSNYLYDQELRTANQAMVRPMVKTFENRIGTNSRTIWLSNDQPLGYVQKSDAVQDNKNSLIQLAQPFVKENYELHYD